MEQALLAEVVKYLESAMDSYPAGISIKALSRCEEQLYYGPGRPDILFLWPRSAGAASLFAGAEGALLEGAIFKGLQRSLESVGILLVRGSGEGALEELRRRAPKAVVALGPKAWNIFGEQAAAGFRMGELKTAAAAAVMPTHALEDVVAAQPVKKEFWMHLKIVMAEIARRTDG